MKSILIIGIGRFGKHLATYFSELGNEVMVVDQDEETVQDMASVVTTTHVGDCKDEEVVKLLGVNNFDLCFVCIGDDFQSSLEVTSLLKENGAKYVISKAERDVHAKFLLRNGADEVIYPERDMARKTSRRFSARNVFDYMEITPEYAVFEIPTPASWVGKSPSELAIRARYDINIVATKEDNRVTPMTNPARLFRQEEHLLVIGLQKDLIRTLDRL